MNYSSTNIITMFSQSALISLFLIVCAYLVFFPSVSAFDSSPFYLYRHTYSSDSCATTAWKRTAGVQAGVCVTQMALLAELLNVPADADFDLACAECRGFMYNTTSSESCEEGVFSVYKDVDCEEAVSDSPLHELSMNITNAGCEASPTMRTSASTIGCTDDYYSVRPRSKMYYSHT